MKLWRKIVKTDILSQSFKGPRGGSQLWMTTRHQIKKTLLFSLDFTERPPFLPTFNQWPPIFNKFLVTERPWHIFVTQDPSFPHLIVKQVTIFGQRLDFSQISTNLTKCWEIFGHFGPESPYFLCNSMKGHLFLCTFSLKDPPFRLNLSPKDPTSQVLGGTRTSLLYVSVPPPPRQL